MQKNPFCPASARFTAQRNSRPFRPCATSLCNDGPRCTEESEIRGADEADAGVQTHESCRGQDVPYKCAMPNSRSHGIHREESLGDPGMHLAPADQAVRADGRRDKGSDAEEKGNGGAIALLCFLRSFMAEN